MSRHATDMHEEYVPPSPPPLPADHVLQSAAVLFPGAFDQHGCPLIVFPADTQARLSSQLCKAEVVDFINYFLCLHNKQQDKESLVSVVADLRHASLPTTRVIAETLLLLEQHKRTVHCVYFIQPKKKDAVKLLLKLLAPSKSYAASFRKVLLKEISDLSNYIDRSQLTASLGGYLVYCHHSWVAFIKEIDEFVQEFLSVVQRLPPCISTLQALSRLPLPSTFSELQHFCSTNEATFQHLRRELGLDDLLRRCEAVLERLRYPEREPCYQAMVGTALFTHTAFDMLQNHSRITAAVEKVELLWQQAFSKARLQLQLFQLREDALQITEQIKTLLQERLQPYKIEVAKDAAKAVMLVSEFEASIHTPAMALIRGAEDVIQAVAELLLFDGPTRERWVLDVERLKEKLHSAVNFILQTLRAVSSFHRYYNKANNWYGRVLCENVLQALLSGVHGDGVPTQRKAGSWGTIPAWRYKVSTFLKKNPPPDTQELVHLAHLSNAIPEDEVQAAGRRMSQRCTILRKLLVCSGAVAVGHLQLALQWQYELLRSSHVTRSSADAVTGVHDLANCETAKEAALHLGASPTVVSGTVSAEGKPPSLSSFDSGVDGVGSSQLEASGGREGMEGLSRLAGTRDCARPTVSRPQIHKENVSDLEDYREEFDVGSVGNSSRASIQIIPNVTVDSLNLEIKVKRSAALPNNPWLSLPVDDLENSYTVTITQNPAPQKRDPQSHDRPGGTEAATSSTQSRDWMLHSQSSLEDPDLSPIRNILSSTITDGRSVCTTEGIPTLLWDSYDLHHQNQDAVDSVIDISLSDWDVKEQEELKEVEKILDRADEILEKEENVLAQEAVLDALLRSEDRHRHEWPPWDSEDQLMSCSELAEAGVLGLEDPLDPAESDHLVGSTRETSGAAEGAFPSGPDLLTEIRRVHDLDDLIMEEKLKIHELRRCGENPKEELSVGKPADRNGPSSMSKEREAFRFRLEKEKKEVEILERSVDKERKEKDGARRVVKCSIMEKARRETREDQALCDELLSSHRSQRRRSTSDDSQDDSQDDTCESGNPDVADEATPHNSVQPPDSQCRDDSSAAEQSVLCRTSSDLEEAPEEVGIKPPRRIHGNVDSSSCDMPDDGALDPGETSNLPPEPGNASLPVNEPPPSTELQDPARSSGAPDPGFVQLDEALDETPAMAHDLVVHLNATERSCNNNNNNCVLTEKCEASLENLEIEISTKGDEDPAGLLQTDRHPEQEVQTLSAADERRAPQPPLEFDPGGRDGVRTPEAVRISGSGSPGIPAQLINMTGIADFKTPIVMDTGSGLMKAGFADQDLPKVIFPTIIGMPKYEEIMNGDLERETYIGHAAQHMRGVLALKHPIKNGIIRNWDEMEKIWHHTFQQLCVDPEDHPVLLTEAAMNPLDHRQRAVEIMFESFNVPFTYVAMQAVLALYAAGRTTGVVFDSGDGVSHSVPVFEGYCLPHAVQRLPLAGGDVTMHLQKLLQEQGVCMRTTAEVEIVREMKERCCCVALDYEAELSAGGASCRERHYTMPDGQIVTLDTERFRAPEILFKPELIGRDHYGMHESVFRSILSSDIDLRRSFLGNIVLSGGNTLLPGLPERLQAEIRGLLPADMPPGSVRVAGAEGRDFAVWRGGAVLADLHVHPAAWISREEYEEYGPQIVFRKCF